MSNRSFINWAAKERRQRLVVGRIVAAVLGVVPGLVGGLQLIQHGVHRLVGIGGLALTLHRVEIVHIGRIGLFIVAEQTHRISRSIEIIYSTTLGTRKKWSSVAGAFLTTSSAISPSLT